MRWAPAPAMTMELICWLSWFTLPVNCRAMFRKGISTVMSKNNPERLTLGSPVRMNTPPARARPT